MPVSRATPLNALLPLGTINAPSNNTLSCSDLSALNLTWTHRTTYEADTKSTCPSFFLLNSNNECLPSQPHVGSLGGCITQFLCVFIFESKRKWLSSFSHCPTNGSHSFAKRYETQYALLIAAVAPGGRAVTVWCGQALVISLTPRDILLLGITCWAPQVINYVMYGIFTNPRGFNTSAIKNDKSDCANKLRWSRVSCNILSASCGELTQEGTTHSVGCLPSFSVLFIYCINWTREPNDKSAQRGIHRSTRVNKGRNITSVLVIEVQVCWGGEMPVMWCGILVRTTREREKKNYSEKHGI